MFFVLGILLLLFFVPETSFRSRLFWKLLPPKHYLINVRTQQQQWPFKPACRCLSGGRMLEMTEAPHAKCLSFYSSVYVWIAAPAGTKESLQRDCRWFEMFMAVCAYEAGCTGCIYALNEKSKQLKKQTEKKKLFKFWFDTETDIAWEEAAALRRATIKKLLYSHGLSASGSCFKSSIFIWLLIVPSHLGGTSITCATQGICYV